jgi:hypothetical protein
VNLVDRFGRGWLTVGLGAVVPAWFASRLLGLRFGLPLGEGTGLPLAGAEGIVALAAQTFDFGLQVVNPSLKELAVGAENGFHTRIIRGSWMRSCAGSKRRRIQLSLGR